jgi:hypothetical protein
MHVPFVAVLPALVGCASHAALDLLESLSDGERTQAQELLTADARLVTAADTIVGRDDVLAELSVLPAGGRASGHHDVAQLELPEAVLFAMGSDAVHSLSLLDGEGSDEPPSVLDDYVALWNEPDAARREDLLVVFATDGRYVDPTVDVSGREAFAAHLAAFRDTQAGTTLALTGGVRQAGDWYLFEWTMQSGGRTTPGTDVVQLDDEGRVALVAGFF